MAEVAGKGKGTCRYVWYTCVVVFAVVELDLCEGHLKARARETHRNATVNLTNWGHVELVKRLHLEVIVTVTSKNAVMLPKAGLCTPRLDHEVCQIC